MNRDFTNMLQFGLIEGMFKYKMSGVPDCTAEGMTLMRAMNRLSIKMETPQSNDQDFLNIFQLWISFSSRCNYFATIQGVVVSR
mmetsp:Transcript_19956/g.26937  ORF Transcript_19956/g.26937 Transcript_19956/m.26937 type:complete len:84 (+) Transcript_19956:147-398(+)